MNTKYISDILIKTILSAYELPLDGTHGITHWARVIENGQLLAEENGADLEIITLFAFFHDCKRQNENRDDGHGRRGGDFAYNLRGDILTLDDRRFDLLYYACEFHTAGQTKGNLTVKTCWDADRLDLNRVKVTPDPNKLCTEYAKKPEIIAWAGKRAMNRFSPDIVDAWKKCI